MTEAASERVSWIRAGLGCRCPRCGRGRLYEGFLQVAEACRACGLRLKDHDSADGPAVFVVLILGFIVVALALAVELAYEPAMWLQLVLWVPFIIVGTALMLRPAKAIFIALHYRHKAHDHGDTG